MAAKPKMPNGPVAPALPAGFGEIAPEIEGWWAPKEPSAGKFDTLQGQIITAQRTQDDDRRLFYIVRLAAPASASNIGGVSGDEGVGTLEEGQYIAVGEKTRLKPLREYVTNQCHVYVAYLGKQKLKAGRDLSRFKIGAKSGSKRAPLVLTQDETIEGEEAPF